MSPSHRQPDQGMLEGLEGLEGLFSQMHALLTQPYLICS